LPVLFLLLFQKRLAQILSFYAILALYYSSNFSNQADPMASGPKRYLMYVEQNYSYAILRPIQEAIWARGDEVSWFIGGDEADINLLKPNENQLHNTEQVKAYNPCAVFVPGNVVPHFFPGVKVGVFHGFYTGKRGLSHFNIRGFFDLYCPQGPSTTGPFKKLADELGFFRIVQTGWPKLDPLFKPKPAKTSTKPSVLFASTFSTKITAAPQVFEEIKRLSQTGKWNWLVTLHPKMAKETIAAYRSLEGPNLRFIENEQVLSALQEADAMLCDTSSIISEFLMLQKPVVTYKTLFNGKHLINIESTDKIESSLEQALTRPAELMHDISAYTQDIHPNTDGQASERVLAAVDWFLETGHIGLKKKPLNVVRKFKIRKKLKFFKL
jgi:hypothetical protein